MFSAACAQAQQFTHPVIISFRSYNGKCGSGIGTFVVVNNEGWIITAHHIIQQIISLEASVTSYRELVAKRADIENNSSLKNHERINQLKKVTIPPDMITDWSSWWGWDGVNLNTWSFVEDADIAAGQLIGFKPEYVGIYPQFKDSTKPMDPGTSLCKLGFPFHLIVPTFDEANGHFVLPPGSVPPPLFPMDGIFTRTVSIDTPAQRPYSLEFLETSTPGLRGQSGGPTFDVHGAIWALQSQTHHMKLGFEGAGSIPAKESEFLRNQYLHVGWGTHARTITGFLNELNINFQVSAH